MENRCLNQKLQFFLNVNVRIACVSPYSLLPSLLKTATLVPLLPVFHVVVLSAVESGVEVTVK